MPVQSHILTTKIHRPELGSDFVCRDKIIDQLNGSELKPMILFSAPAGYGKSTTIIQWLKKSKTKSVWLSLDEEDNDLNAFLHYVYHALNNEFPNHFKPFHDLLSGVKLPPINVLCASISNLINQLNDSVILVLDDYHLISNSDVHSFIDCYLAHPSKNLHLVISTRRDPPLKMSKLRVYHQMDEFRMKDLAFDSEETSDLFRKLLNGEISSRLLQILLEKTEGWIIGLKILFLNVTNEEELNVLIDSLGDNLYYMAEFLLEEIIEKQSEPIQEIMLMASLLKRFNEDFILELSKGVLDEEKRAQAYEDFKKIIDNNLFIIRLDEDKKWYRYHHLFQDLLLQLLKRRKSEDEIKDIHILASDWFERNDLIDEAIYHAAEAEQFQLVADIFNKNRIAIIDKEDINFMEKWINMLPHEMIEKSASLLQAQSVIAQFRYDLDRLIVLTDKTENFYKNSNFNKELFGEWCHQKGWILVFVEGKIEEGLEVLSKSLENVPDYPVRFVRAEAEMLYAITMQMTGMGVQALEQVERKIVLREPEKGLLFERLVYAKMAVNLLSGNLLESQAEAIRFRNYAQLESTVNLQFWAAWFLGTIALQRSEYQESKNYLKRVLEVQFVSEDRTVVDGFEVLAMAHQFLGETSEAEKILEKGLEFAEWSNNPEHRIILNAAQARIKLLQGDYNWAFNWLDSYNIEAHIPSMLFFAAQPAITHCRVLIEKGDVKSLAIADELLLGYNEELNALHNTFQTIEVQVLQVISHLKQDREKEAMALLKSLVKETKYGGWLRPYVEMGKPMKGLLIRLREDNVEVNYVSRIIQHIELFEKSQSNKTRLPQSNQSSNDLRTPKEILSVREAEILDFIAQGYRNKEIARKLFIAENTVKKHISNMFKKFEVSSRISLLEKSKLMGFSATLD